MRRRRPAIVVVECPSRIAQMVTAKTARDSCAGIPLSAALEGGFGGCVPSKTQRLYWSWSEEGGLHSDKFTFGGEVEGKLRDGKTPERDRGYIYLIRSFTAVWKAQGHCGQVAGSRPMSFSVHISISSLQLRCSQLPQFGNDPPPPPDDPS